MGVGVKIPIHEAIIFNLDSASADRLLQKYPSSIFFIGEKLIDGLPIPSGLITPAKEGRKGEGGERKLRHGKDDAAICA